MMVHHEESSDCEQLINGIWVQVSRRTGSSNQNREKKKKVQKIFLIRDKAFLFVVVFPRKKKDPYTTSIQNL